MSDAFAHHAPGLDSPADHAAAIDYSGGDAALDPPCRAIYVGTGGDLEVTTVGGETVTFVGVPSGSIVPIRAVAVIQAGSTATDLLALW